jgi:hypothetical protein
MTVYIKIGLSQWLVTGCRTDLQVPARPAIFLFLTTIRPVTKLTLCRLLSQGYCRILPESSCRNVNLIAQPWIMLRARMRGSLTESRCLEIIQVFKNSWICRAVLSCDYAVFPIFCPLPFEVCHQHVFCLRQELAVETERNVNCSRPVLYKWVSWYCTVRS